MKDEETLISNDIQIPIGLNLTPNQSLNQKEEFRFEFFIKKIKKNFYYFFV